MTFDSTALSGRREGNELRTITTKVLIPDILEEVTLALNGKAIPCWGFRHTVGNGFVRAYLPFSVFQTPPNAGWRSFEVHIWNGYQEGSPYGMYLVCGNPVGHCKGQLRVTEGMRGITRKSLLEKLLPIPGDGNLPKGYLIILRDD